MRRTTPIIHKTRTQVVVKALRKKILSGYITAGEPLRQSALTNELNVSRIPVREVLLQLEVLIRFKAHQGTMITEFPVKKITELFKLRAMIETNLLPKAIPNLEDEHLLQTEKILDELESAFKREDTIVNWSEFYTSLYQAAQ